MSEDEASKALDRIVTKASRAAKELMVGMSPWELAVEEAITLAKETNREHVVYWSKHVDEDGSEI